MIKDGKIFGKINLVDFFVLVIVILLIMAAFMKFNKFKSPTSESSNTEIVYQFKVKNIRDFTADAFKIGDTVYDSQTGIDIGKITNIERISAETYDTLLNGKLIDIDNEYKFDIILTIETVGSVETNAYYANKTIELKIDSEKKIETKYVKTTGVISKIDTKVEQ